MSSFICEPKQFNSIEIAVRNLALGDSFYFPYSFKDRLPELYKRSTGIDIKADKVRDIIDTLRRINVLCVSLQYAHHYEGVLDKEIEDQTKMIMNRKEFQHLTKVELYKSLSCVNYQIELEHLKELRQLTEDEETAMFFLREFTDCLAHDIVSNLQEYETAKWSI
jgi:hypothetical protein